MRLKVNESRSFELLWNKLQYFKKIALRKIIYENAPFLFGKKKVYPCIFA